MVVLAAALSLVCTINGKAFGNLQYLQEAPTPVAIPATATDQEVTDFFNGADGDKDSFLTKEEIKAFYLASSQAIPDADLDAAFTKADADADGKLTSTELRASIPAPAAEPVTPTDPATPTEPVTPVVNKTEPATPTEPVTPV